jgi:AcrR family transcriptional regulator
LAAAKAGTRRTEGIRTRGRSQRVVERVFGATAHELSRVGFAEFRVEDVADRSGVNKTTIYRRWPSKAELVAATVKSLVRELTPIDTGSLRGDLRASILEELAHAAHPRGRGIMRILQSERTVPGIDALARRLRAEQHRARVTLIERGIERGELPEGTDADLVVDLVSAPVLRRVFTFGERVDERYIDSILDVVLPGFDARSHESGR